MACNAAWLLRVFRCSHRLSQAEESDKEEEEEEGCVVLVVATTNDKEENNQTHNPTVATTTTSNHISIADLQDAMRHNTQMEQEQHQHQQNDSDAHLERLPRRKQRTIAEQEVITVDPNNLCHKETRHPTALFGWSPFSSQPLISSPPYSGCRLSAKHWERERVPLYPTSPLESKVLIWWDRCDDYDDVRDEDDSESDDYAVQEISWRRKRDTSHDEVQEFYWRRNTTPSNNNYKIPDCRVRINTDDITAATMDDTTFSSSSSSSTVEDAIYSCSSSSLSSMIHFTSESDSAPSSTTSTTTTMPSSCSNNHLLALTMDWPIWLQPVTCS